MAMGKISVSCALLGLLFFFSNARASDAAPSRHVLDVCYAPIYYQYEVPISLDRFLERCTQLGRMEEDDLRYRNLMNAMGDWNSAVKRAKQLPNSTAKSRLTDIRVRIVIDSGKVMLIDKYGNGMYGDQPFRLTEKNLAKIERILGGIYDCIEYHAEQKRKSAP